MKPPLIVLLGPTAVGKTELSLRLAERLPGEIISSDSRLFYRGMDIGTAKPTAAEMTRVHHHLIDVANPDETWGLAVFQQEAQRVIGEIHQRGKMPLLVGGTGQYVRAVTEGWTPPEVRPDPRLREALEQMVSAQGENGIYWLHDRLRIIDPEAAGNIDPRNVRRTVRALEVIFSTGKRFSEQRGQAQSPYQLIQIGLKRPRAELYERVDARIESMFENGFLDEVRALLEKGYSTNLPTMSAIGYRECVAVLRGEISLDEAKTQIKRITRIFVRRQGNWFKEDDPKIRWFDAASVSVDEIENHIRQALASPSS